MAIKIDDEIVHSSMTEVLLQNIDNFNAGTAGAITLSSRYIMGDGEDYSNISEIANLIARRDITSGAAATVKTIDTIDKRSIVCYYSTGSIEFKLVDEDRYSSSEGFSAAIGEQIGVGLINYMLNQGISATVGAIGSTTSLVEGDGLGALTFSLLNTGLALLGDASQSIVAFVMTGVNYHNLVGDSIANYAVDSVTGGAIQTGSTYSLGRPVYVTDAPGLSSVAVGEAVLGLTAGALKMAETKGRNMVSEVVSGRENLVQRIQLESDVLLDVKGFTYVGADNPDTAALELTTNWAYVNSDIKSGPGILINTI